MNSAEIINLAMSSGFELAGITKAKIPEEDKANINLWIQKKLFGDMEWFPKNNHIRLDFENLGFIPKSVIMLGCSYYSKKNEEVLRKFKFKISRYAVGKDYHNVLREKVKPLMVFLKDKFPVGKFRMSTDSLPISEKVLANEAGLGWRGKNTNIINPEVGSFFFLAAILTDVSLSPNAQKIPDRCGKCRLCIEACPTGALFEEYKIDARKCISYLTIEEKMSISADSFGFKTNGWIFGCDICQEVCPWNRKKTNIFRMETKEPDFLASDLWRDSSEKEILEMEPKEFTVFQKDSPLSRISFQKWRRNIQNFLD